MQGNLKAAFNKRHLFTRCSTISCPFVNFVPVCILTSLQMISKKKLFVYCVPRQWNTKVSEFFSIRKYIHTYMCHTTQFYPMYFTKPRILRCMSLHPNFSNVCHTAQNSLMYVTPPSFLCCMSHSPKFSDVRHIAWNSPMYVTQPSFLWYKLNSPEFSDVCHTT